MTKRILEHVVMKRKSSTISKTNNTTQGNKPEGTGKRRKTKKISRQDKTILT